MAVAALKPAYQRAFGGPLPLRRDQTVLQLLRAVGIHCYQPPGKLHWLIASSREAQRQQQPPRPPQPAQQPPLKQGEAEAQEECGICLEDLPAQQMVQCADDHHVCRGCLSAHVCAQCRATISLDELSEQGRADGSVRCPVPGCRHAYSARQIALLADSEEGDVASGGAGNGKCSPSAAPSAFSLYLQLQLRLREQAVLGRAQAQVEAATKKVNEQLAAAQARLRVDADRTLLQQQLRLQMPNARQCGRCSFGPIDHHHCSNLRTHHGEKRNGGAARVNNSCPKCGWFAANISAWPRWDGELGAAADAQQHPAA